MFGSYSVTRGGGGSYVTITDDSLDLSIHEPHSHSLDIGPLCAGTTTVVDRGFTGTTNSKGGCEKLLFS